jgi:hypothetical protein
MLYILTILVVHYPQNGLKFVIIMNWQDIYYFAMMVICGYTLAEKKIGVIKVLANIRPEDHGVGSTDHLSR